MWLTTLGCCCASCEIEQERQQHQEHEQQPTVMQQDSTYTKHWKLRESALDPSTCDPRHGVKAVIAMTWRQRLRRRSRRRSTGEKLCPLAAGDIERRLLEGSRHASGRLSGILSLKYLKFPIISHYINTGYTGMGQLWINDCPIYMGSWTDSRDVFKMCAFKDLTFWLLDLTHGGMNCESAAVIFVRLVEIAWWHALYPWHSNEQLHELGLVCQQRSDQFAHVLSDKLRLNRNWHDFVKWKKQWWIFRFCHVCCLQNLSH